jgi:inner membrane protein
MPTVVAHAAVGWAAARHGSSTLPRDEARPLALVAALLAMLPDLDVIGFGLGIPYGARLGHRGFSHSLTFAVGSALVGHAALRWHSKRRGRTAPGIVAYLLLLLAAASHPLLDMLTDGGLGVALLAPLSWTRLFFPVTPIPVSPIGVDGTTGYVLAWEAVLLSPLALGVLLADRYGSPGARRWLRWSALAVTLLGFGIRAVSLPQA